MPRRSRCLAGSGGPPARIMACRTAALGGHVRQCPAGHVTEVWYNSCRHRACPRCCFQRITQWLDQWQEQLLPTDHFHVIFTLPSELHELWRWNRARMTEVLFSQRARDAADVAGGPQMAGGHAGDLGDAAHVEPHAALHPHVHCLVSGGGLTVEGSGSPSARGFCCRWRWCGRCFGAKCWGQSSGCG